MTEALHRKAMAGRTLALAAMVLVLAAGPGRAQRPPPRDGSALPPGLGVPWGKMNVMPGGPVDMRPFPPRAGRTRCIGVNGVAGAQMFGDRAIELTMRDGRRFRMFFARECPALSFYQGFYYRRMKAGQLCAGRDVIGARSGGECPIASIIPVRRFRR